MAVDRCVVIVVAVVLLLAISGAAAAKKKKTRLDKLFKARPDDGVLTLTSSNFTRLAMSGPRPYGVLVLFTARGANYDCKACIPAEEEFRLAASSYMKGAGASDASASSSSSSGGQAPLFFAITDFDDNTQAFRQFGFRMVPVVIYRSPSTAVSATVQDFHDEGNRYVPRDGGVEGLLEFLRQRGGPEVAVYHAPDSMIPLSMAVAVVTGLVFAYVAAHPSWLLFPMKKNFWLVVSLAIYAVSISGIIYCVIRDAEWYRMDAKNHVQFFDGDARNQFVAEGIAMGAMHVGAAGAVIALVVLSRRRGQSTFFNVVLGAFCVTIFGVLCVCIAQQYEAETHWYKVEGTVDWPVLRKLKRLPWTIAYTLKTAPSTIRMAVGSVQAAVTS